MTLVTGDMGGPDGVGGKLGGGVGLQILLDSKAAKETFCVTFTFLLSKFLFDPPRHKPLTHPSKRLCAFFLSSKQSAAACTTSLLQLGHLCLGLCVPVPQRLVGAWDPIAFVSAFTDATNVTLVAVRVALALTNSAKTDFSVVTAAASVSKYSSKVLLVMSGGPPGGVGGGA